MQKTSKTAILNIIKTKNWYKDGSQKTIKFNKNGTVTVTTQKKEKK